MDNSIEKNLKQTLSYIKSKTTLKPKIGIVLGSGLGDYAENLDINSILDTSKIPNYPQSTVEGHKGKLIFGNLKNIPIIAFQGRVHFYETGNLQTALYPIFVAYKLGVKIIILTNAAGGVNRHFHPGDLMLIKDQINLTFENPVGLLKKIVNKNSPVYDQNLINLIIKVADESNIPLREGIYVGVKGPSYETASEVEMVRRIGGDAVGMSTVNEASLANALGMKVAGITCITNYATGVINSKLSHDEVTIVANKVKNRFSDLISSILKTIKI